MTRCPYCGRECPDDAVVCPIDQMPLEHPIKSAKEEVAVIALSATGQEPSPLGGQENAIYPEYRWSARDGWKFLGMALVLDVLSIIVTHALYVNVPLFRAWRSGPFGTGMTITFIVTNIIFVVVNVFVAAYFARTDTVAAFCEATGLNRKPTHYAWAGVTIAFVLQFAAHVISSGGGAPNGPNSEFEVFGHVQGGAWFLLFFPVLLAPFWEEPVMRGFLYKAFRHSYPVAPSVAIIVLLTLVGTWNRYFYSCGVIFGVIAITAVQCYLREKSESLWDCILCHFVFNGSAVFFSGALR